MSDDIERDIRQRIIGGAAEGARAAARQIIETANIQLEDVVAALEALIPAPVTCSGSVSLSSMGVRGDVTIHLPTARLSLATAPPTVNISPQDVASAFEDISNIGESDRLPVRSPVLLSRPQLICVALLIIIDVYIALPPAAQEYLLAMGGLIQGIAAIIDLLSNK